MSKSGFRFKEGKLFLFDNDSVCLIESWPSLKALHKIGASGWQEFRPIFPLLSPIAVEPEFDPGLLPQESFQQTTGGARLEKNSPRISQMGTDDPIKLGLAEKSKNLASLLAEFLFYPAPFAQRMHSCPFLHIRVHPSNRWFYIILSCSIM